MNDKDLIKQLKSLKQVQPSKDWAILARADIVSHVEASEPITYNLRPKKLLPTSYFLRQIPKPAMGLISIFFIITALAFVGFLGNTPKEVVLSQRVGSSSVAEPEDLTLLEQEEPIELALEDPTLSRRDFGGSGLPGTEIVVEQGGLTIQTILDQTYASLYIYDEDLSTAYKASLRERINRITVLAQEAGNFYVEELAREADELFADEDYDASLRVVVLAESLL